MSKLIETSLRNDKKTCYFSPVSLVLQGALTLCVSQRAVPPGRKAEHNRSTWQSRDVARRVGGEGWQRWVFFDKGYGMIWLAASYTYIYMYVYMWLLFWLQVKKCITSKKEDWLWWPKTGWLLVDFKILEVWVISLYAAFCRCKWQSKIQ